ncbi:MAG TPA: acyl-CoA dehydrogenase family protein [Pseudonocardiaceae bacterium]|nr:acyl-CoA dehydrogenase family protein [Pseudonocardiaceae bacterium]
MDFAPTEAQRDLSELTRGILADEPGDAIWAALTKAGVLAAALPESLGGNGFGILEQCTVAQELGRVAAAAPYVDSIMLGAAGIARFGTTAQQATWAAPAANGDLLLTTALSAEPVTARRADNGWRLSGTRTGVPFAAEADAVLVPTDNGVFLVTPTDSGVTISPQELVDQAPAGQLELDEAVLGEDHALDAAAAEWLAVTAAIGLSATQLGVTERALEMTAEYARTRVQFDRPIGTFQAVAQRLADAYIDVEAIRLSLWQAAWRASEDLPCAAEAETAKFWAADGGHRVAHTAVHVHGGMGIDTDHPLHRYFLAAKRNEFHLGHATDHLRALGDILAAEPA